MKNVSCFESWLTESHRGEFSLDKSKDLCKKIAEAVPGRCQVRTVSMPGDISTVYFTFMRGNTKYEFEIRPYADEMAITQRSGSNYTGVKRYTAKNFFETAQELFRIEANYSLDLKKVRGLIAGERFNF